jgi:hypothetical protein
MTPIGKEITIPSQASAPRLESKEKQQAPRWQRLRLIIGTALFTISLMVGGNEVTSAQDVPPASTPTVESPGDPSSEAPEWHTTVFEAVTKLFNKTRDSLTTEKFTLKQQKEGEEPKFIEFPFAVGQITSSFKNAEQVTVVMNRFIQDAMLEGALVKEPGRNKNEILTEQIRYWSEEYTLKLTAAMASLQADVDNLITEHNAKVDKGEAQVKIPLDREGQSTSVELFAALSPARAAVLEIMLNPDRELTDEQKQVIIKIITTDYAQLRKQITVTIDQQDTALVIPSYFDKDLFAGINAELFSYNHSENAQQRFDDYKNYGVDPQLHPDEVAKLQRLRELNQ